MLGEAYCARATVGTCIIAGGTRGAARSGPAVATGAIAIGHKASDGRRMTSAVLCHCANPCAGRVVVVAGGAPLARCTGVVHLAGASTATFATRDAVGVVVAVELNCADAGTLRVVDVARGADGAVRASRVVCSTRLALATAPLVAALTGAAVDAVSSDVRGVTTAIDGHSACGVAIWVGAELFEPGGARRTVGRGIELCGA